MCVYSLTREITVFQMDILLFLIILIILMITYKTYHFTDDPYQIIFKIY